ncbi:hypothetical protein B0T10DRAFT_42231 [Thelonectria olida]|uniref:Uncharacterized protein n=1 Tax=Thelonectria olida TaxID=1576542 RepID=A0A9P9AST5_9HYPO|nr:hypothetical protein B0T10DRAFT_42231 [Thelonectria olida]
MLQAPSSRLQHNYRHEQNTFARFVPLGTHPNALLRSRVGRPGDIRGTPRLGAWVPEAPSQKAYREVRCPPGTRYGAGQQTPVQFTIPIQLHCLAFAGHLCAFPSTPARHPLFCVFVTAPCLLDNKFFFGVESLTHFTSPTEGQRTQKCAEPPQLQVRTRHNAAQATHRAPRQEGICSMADETPEAEARSFPFGNSGHQALKAHPSTIVKCPVPRYS